MPGRFDVERDLIARLLNVLGVSATTSNPQKTHGRETGADVAMRLGSSTIGVQVTEYHGDEGNAGSTLRAREESDASQGIIRAYAVPTNASAGLTKRINDKIAKAIRYNFEEFTEVWLLIAASLPNAGAAAATSVVPIFITAEWLEQHYGKALRGGQSTGAYFFMCSCGRRFSNGRSRKGGKSFASPKTSHLKGRMGNDRSTARGTTNAIAVEAKC